MTRTRRPLRVPKPEAHAIDAADGVRLALTRYRGGSRGPVMLVHCIGVSSGMYTLDTIETNLLEYLTDGGYDVWLLDFRFSIRLPESAKPHSFDEVATRDYPAAVAAVREISGRPSVQVVGHGVGASTLTMALLAGLQGVRSAVCSQVSTDLVLPAAMQLRADLRLTAVAEAAGLDTLTAAPLDPTGADRLFDALLRLQPVDREERCSSTVCHRITAMYGELYQHSQLNGGTHDALGEEFGVASVRAFSQLSLLGRKGHLVDEQGAEAYLPHVERLALPMAFIHGGKNECVLPQATELTLQRLAAANGASWYSRTVIGEYGHVDCIIGRDASRDVYPHIRAHLDDTA